MFRPPLQTLATGGWESEVERASALFDCRGQEKTLGLPHPLCTLPKGESQERFGVAPYLSTSK